MSVAITFRDQAEQECRDYEYPYSSLDGCEAESLPHFVEFEMLAALNQGKIYGMMSNASAQENMGCTFPGDRPRAFIAQSADINVLEEILSGAEQYWADRKM